MNSEEQTYTTNRKSKLLQGIILGAIAGAAISMLDRHTRESAITCTKKGVKTVRNVVENPEIITNSVKETTEKIRATIESMTEDVAIITNQVELLRDITPQVAAVVKETKEVMDGTIKRIGSED